MTSHPRYPNKPTHPRRRGRRGRDLYEELFEGAVGFAFDNTDLSTLYQDRAGTTPVTAPAQLVGLRLSKDRGLVLGSELVTNGTFDANTTGWVAASSATLQSVAGQFVVTNGAAAFGFAYGAITTVVGRYYRLTGQVIGASASWVFRVGDDTAASVNQKLALAGTIAGQSVSAIFQATATTTYVRLGLNNSTIGATATFDNISVRELPGNHAVAINDPARGTYGIRPRTGRRNLLTYTEQFDNAAWNKVNASVTANTAEAPDGTTTAEDYIPAAGTVSPEINRIMGGLTISAAYTHSVYLKDTGNGSGWFELTTTNPTVRSFFDIRNGVKGVGAGVMEDVGGGWYRCSVPTIVNATSSVIYVTPRSSNGNSGPITATAVPYARIWGAQFETGSTATAYQKAVTQFEVTEAGVPSCHYIRYDGANTGYVTPTITPGTDKVQVFAGVRKLSDATSVIVEHSATIDANNGAFHVAPVVTNSSNQFASKGTTIRTAIATGTASPVSLVITGLGDISGDSSTLRVNGSQVAQTLVDQGTGNYLAYPIYLGRRGGTSLPFNGEDTGIIGRFGPVLAADVINRVELKLNQNTGAF